MSIAESPYSTRYDSKQASKADASKEETSLWLRYLPIALSVIVGITVSITAYFLVDRWESERVRANFHEAAEDRAFAIQRALDHKRELLQTANSFFQANHGNVSSEQFRVFSRSFLANNPDIQTLEWLPRVTDSERSEFEAQAQRSFSQFQITELSAEEMLDPAEQRAEYFPIYYVQPLTGNEDSVGFDLASDPALQELLNNARDTSELQMISHTTLVQDTADQHGSVMFLPIYRPDTVIKTVGQRQEELIGFIMAIFQIQNLLDTAMNLLDPRPIDIRVFDESPEVGQEILYFHPGQLDEDRLAELEGQDLGEDEQEDASMQVREQFLVGGRTLAVVCTPAPGYHLTTGGGWQAWGILVLGMLMTLLLAGYFYTTMRHAFQMAEVAESANHAQSKFLSGMSHQMRTPLNAIIGYSELLQEEAEDLDDPTILQDVEKIYISARYLLSMSDGILDLSKIKAGRIEVHSETCKIAHLVEDIEGIASLLVKKNGNKLNVRCPQDIGTMQTDVTRLHQILFSLLNNASDNTKQGEIILDVAREITDGQEWVRFMVADTSGGMTPEHRDWLVTALSQTANLESDEDIRIGLVISSHFWQMMGGNITVESEPGKGSTFILRLPVHMP